jgi:5-oxoprolinase (ATP-hydrolysing)
MLLSDLALVELEPSYQVLEQEARRSLVQDGAQPEHVEVERLLDVRYAGTETVISVALAAAADVARDFVARFRALFGHSHDQRALELSQIRLIARAVAPPERLPPSAAGGSAPQPRRHSRWFVDGQWLESVPVYWREQLTPGRELRGPAIVAEAGGTIALEPGFRLRAEATGLLRMEAEANAPSAAAGRDDASTASADPVLLEIYANRFMSIAEQMGRTLRLTAASVNIRERRDFSCAVFDRHGELVANAPHIPVHLGAMSASVRAIIASHPELRPGEIFVTNDPAHGGSHLPDVTVVAPVHDAGGKLRFFTAARGHHADIGGSTPGSMPAFSTTLAEEGVVLRNVKASRAGKLEPQLLLALLAAGRYPARNPRENLADLEAQLAAAHTGGALLGALVGDRGSEEVERYMAFVQDNAALEVQRALRSLKPGRHAFSDTLDDGTPISVTLEASPHHLLVDFSGTGAEHSGNLNAPHAVTLACVLYFLRVLVGKPIPLNSGCLRHVELRLPERSLLSPGPERAVAGGNVETSQRVVDTLLAAAGLLAASQGTMNNLSFGDASYGYYETIAGGAGAGFAGASAVHTHMTNTRITDAEVLERRFPVRLLEHSIRRGSGGAGRYPGGDGVRRTFEFLRPTQVSVLSQRRSLAPFGLNGGGPGSPGQNLLNGRELTGACAFDAVAGDRLTILTPGGGGFGTP